MPNDFKQLNLKLRIPIADWEKIRTNYDTQQMDSSTKNKKKAKTDLWAFVTQYLHEGTKYELINHYTGYGLPTTEIDALLEHEVEYGAPFKVFQNNQYNDPGIGIVNGHVTSMSVQMPIIHSSIGNFSEMKFLYIGANSKSPMETIPESLVNLHHLERLVLSNYSFKYVPPVIFSLRSLKALGLQCNELTDLSEDFLSLSRLTSLRLNANKFTEIPWVIGLLPKLRELDLDYNPLNETEQKFGLSFGDSRYKKPIDPLKEYCRKKRPPDWHAKEILPEDEV